MKWNILAVATLLVLALATPAAAATTGLGAGGRTLSGPGTTTLGLNGTGTVYTDASGTDVCVTVYNSGANSVRLSLTDGVTTSTIDVALKGSAALCKDQTEQVDLICLGVSGGCRAQWRVDRD